MSIFIPGYKVDDLDLVSPASGSAFVVPGPLVWDTNSDDADPGIDVHFQVQIATNSIFTSIAEEADSWISTTRFEYFSGSWTPLPAAGLPIASVGAQVRYTPALIAAASYFWRVRQIQFLV